MSKYKETRDYYIILNRYNKIVSQKFDQFSQLYSTVLEPTYKKSKLLKYNISYIFNVE